MFHREPFHLSIIPTIENATSDEFRFVIGPLLLRTTIPSNGHAGIIGTIKARGHTMLWDKDMIASIVSALELAEKADKETNQVRTVSAQDDPDQRRRNTEHHNG